MTNRLADFELGERLGGGSFGEVHAVYDRANNARVALKRLRCGDVESLYRFKKEFRVLSDLFHPNLVRLYELFTAGTDWYIAMELVDGVDIVSFARQDSMAFSPTLAVHHAHAQGSTVEDWAALRASFRQFADGISALHDAKRLHRDLKPQNVLVSREGHVKILDFGLATELSDKGASLAQIVGTPAYMAPEQASGNTVTAAADWYGFGTMLYEALAGQLPFDGADVQSILEAKRSTEPRDPRVFNSALPRELCELSMRLLTRDARARPGGAQVTELLATFPASRQRFSSPSPRALLVGRERESKALDSALEEASRGASVVAHVSGASGNGKTALLQDFTSRIEARGDAIVLEGRCYEGEGVAFKAVDTVMDSVAARLAKASTEEIDRVLPRNFDSLTRLFPVLQRLAARTPRKQPREAHDPLEIRRRAFAALRELVGRVADRRLVVVCIDDLQWGDHDSVALLADLVRPPDAPPLLLVLSYRPESDSNDVLRALRAEVRGDRALELSVDPLTPADSAALAHALLTSVGTSAEKDIDAIAQESAGSPLFVHELVRHVLEGARSTADVSIDALIALRVARLDAPSRTLLELVSLAARAMSLTVLRQVAGISGEQSLAALAHLKSEHLVRTRTEGDVELVEAYHDRIRERVGELLDPATMRRWHGLLAGTIEALGEPGDSEAIMTHWREAGDAQRTAKYAAIAAGQATCILAFDRAAHLYELALSLSEPAGSGEPLDEAQLGEVRSLRLRLADALANAGRGALAAAEYRRAALGANDAQALDLERRAAEQLLRSGHFDKGLAVLDAVLRRVGWSLPRTSFGTLVVLVAWRVVLRVRGLHFRERDASRISAHELTRIDICWSAAAALGLVDVLRGAVFQTRHLLLALRAGEIYRVARAMTLEVAYSSGGGNRSWRRTQALMQRSGELAERARHPHARAMHLSTSGLAHFLMGHFGQARTHFAQAEALFRAECVGASYELASLHQLQLQTLYFMGDVRELAARRIAVLREARERGDLFATVNLRVGYPAFVWIVAGDTAGGHADVSAAIAEWTKSDFHLEHLYALIAHSTLDLYAGEASRAYQRVQSEWPRVRRLLLLRIQGVAVDVLALRSRTALALAEAGAQERGLLGTAERCARDIEAERTAWAHPFAGLLRAGVAHLRGDKAGAQGLLARAATEFAQNEMSLHALIAQRCLAEVTGSVPLRDDVEGSMRALGFVDPARACGSLAPGFGFAKSRSASSERPRAREPVVRG